MVFNIPGDEYPNLQFTVFGLLAVTAGLANLRLPETLGRPLPEDIRDMILLGRWYCQINAHQSRVEEPESVTEPAGAEGCWA